MYSNISALLSASRGSLRDHTDTHTHTHTRIRTHVHTRTHTQNNTRLKRHAKMSLTGKGKNNPNKNCSCGYLIWKSAAVRNSHEIPQFQEKVSSLFFFFDIVHCDGSEQVCSQRNTFAQLNSGKENGKENNKKKGHPTSGAA